MKNTAFSLAFVILSVILTNADNVEDHSGEFWSSEAAMEAAMKITSEPANNRDDLSDAGRSFARTTAKAMLAEGESAAKNGKLLCTLGSYPQAP